VAAYAFAFFPWLPAAAHLALVATAYAVVLARTGDSGAPAEWVLLMGTALTVGLVVGLLSRELRQLATTDALTGLPNRHALEALLSRESARAKRTGHPLSVALIDLDDFKQLNDTAGHQAGDDHLRDLARSWAAVLRELDVVARFGGDEFVVLLPDTPAADAEAVLGRLAEAESCSWSAGIGQWEPDEPPEALLARADAALYEAKRQGRRQVVHARQVTAAMPTACVPAGRLPVVPRNDASPKVKMPPSDATSQ
jgi:diguanylate cyclase (GGDEF)-like protein